ncbi:MAG TPA: DUF6157 family protein [Candidatus Limnocylindrales bacterium]|nr:DUF6157 family protein [Candidatus Limnocylindrales bacterium]
MGPTYINTFIAVAEDCPAEAAQVPQEKGGKPSKAAIEYRLIADNPYGLTGDEIQFRAHALHRGIPEVDWPPERERFRPHEQPCLRASALGKRYGWGTHHSAAGRVALVPVESERYRVMAADPALTHLRAMRTRRA